MPTPVSAARQCLTDEAARALDDAVAVARRRGHAQTTSLHVVSALLAFPSSTLREACIRARSSAYSPRLQFRALELSVGVSLDRLPSSKNADDPPVSNSLMAAIKRSQANQRRHPDNFHLYQLHQQQQAASVLKVELKQFILSILDDPIVSRVFGEAGFRSSDIQLAVGHPPVSARARCPPIFLCNLTDSDPGHSGFRFPFMGSPGIDDGDENCRRIVEVLVRKTGKNPLLIGVCANDALHSFSVCVRGGKGGVFPAEIGGLGIVSIETEVSDFVGKDGSEEKMDSKLKEIGDMVKNCSGIGIVVNFGELNPLVSDSASVDAVSYLVSKLTGLLEFHPGKLWLIGAAGSYETYTKLLARFPSIEKDWDLHMLPITSSSRASAEGFCSKPSLMGSFVPFGGFFSTPSDFKIPLSSTNQFITRCHLCNEKYEQEVSAILKGGSSISVADQLSANLSPWLQMAELNPSKAIGMAKAKDNEAAFNAKVIMLQKKWNDICQRLHHTQSPKQCISQAKTQFPGTDDFHLTSDRKESSSKDSSLSESGCANLSPYTPRREKPISVAFEAETANCQSELSIKISKCQQPETESHWFPSRPLPNLSLPPLDHMPSSSVNCLTTDLGLGTFYASTSQEPKKPDFQDHKERLRNISGTVSAEFDVVSESTSTLVSKSSCSGPDTGRQFDPRDIKSLWNALIEKVDRQDEAIRTISQAVSRCRNGSGKRRGSNLKGDIWLSFLGPDKVGKKEIAAAVAETIYGSRENLIAVDMSFQDGLNPSSSLFDSKELNGYDAKFRGKTVVDYISGELSKRPHSVFLLENIDKADLLAQMSLSQAIRTGKFSDSHGREIGINNVIFVTTSTSTKVNKNLTSGKKHVEFLEERILKAKGWQMQILIGDSSRSNGTNVFITCRKGFVNKRKLDESSERPRRDQKIPKSFLDLNLPAEETEDDFECGYSDSESEAWLEDFFDQVDDVVNFEPFDFDSLADEVLKQISQIFQKLVGLKASLEIDEEVMVQILAAAWLTGKKKTAVQDWVERVLGRSFAEARERYGFTSPSVLKLVHCEGVLVEEQAPGVCLPAKIILN